MTWKGKEKNIPEMCGVEVFLFKPPGHKWVTSRPPDRAQSEEHVPRMGNQSMPANER